MARKAAAKKPAAKKSSSSSSSGSTLKFGSPAWRAKYMKKGRSKKK